MFGIREEEKNYQEDTLFLNEAMDAGLDYYGSYKGTPNPNDRHLLALGDRTYLPSNPRETQLWKELSDMPYLGAWQSEKIGPIF